MNNKAIKNAKIEIVNKYKETNHRSYKTAQRWLQRELKKGRSLEDIKKTA